MRHPNVKKNVNIPFGKTLRICLLLLAFCLVLPRGLYAVCAPGQIPVVPSYSFTVPGPDWYRSGCATNLCTNYFGDSAVNYFGVGNSMRYASYDVTYTCPSGCCYLASGGTLDEYQDGVLLAGGAVGWLDTGVHVYRIDNITLKFSDLTEASYVVAEKSYPPVSKTFTVDNDPPQLAFSSPQDNVTVSTNEASMVVSAVDQLSGLETAWLSIESASLGPLPACGLKKTMTGAAVEPFAVHYSSVTYCSDRLKAFLGTSTFCEGNLGSLSNFTKTFDLREYVDLSAEADCSVRFFAAAVDRVGYSTGVAELSFIIDQAPPAINISTWPMVLPHGPVTLIAGSVRDSSEIKSLKIGLRQLDWGGATTYWDGAAWVPAPAYITLTPPQSSSAFDWSYDGLQPKDIRSGSQYKLSVYSVDKFDHAGVSEKDFFYNACTSSQPYAATYNGEDIFEVGTALFREMTTDPLYIGHMGLYIVSDSRYVINNGGSTMTFVQRLAANSGRLLPLLKTDGNHFIVNAVPEGVAYTSAAGFMAAPYWGAYEAPGLEPFGRDRIAYSASMQLGKPYAKMGAKNLLNSDSVFPIGPDWAGGTEPQRFRCDGLAVYAYRQAGLSSAVDSHSNPQKDFPLDLAHLWEVVRTSVPWVSSPRTTSAEDKFNITVQAADDESGIDRVDYFLRTHPTVGYTEFLGTVDNDSLGAADYTLQNTCNPGNNLYARAVDRAGNWQLSDQALSPSRSALPKTYTLPANSIYPLFERIYYNPPISKVYWDSRDDTTPTEKLYTLYTVDIPFDAWDNDNINAVQGGNSSGSFWVDAGTHTLYLAIMDEYGNVTFRQDNITTPDFYAMFDGGQAQPAGDEIALSFESETAPGEHTSAVLPMTWTPPMGYQNSPASAAYDIQTTAQYSGSVGVQIKLAAEGLNTEDKRRLRLLHLNNGAWEDVTVGVDTVNDIIFGYSHTLSPFAVYSSPESVPERSFPDRWPPLTKITADGAEYQTAGGTYYVSTATYLGFAGIDDHAAAVSSYYKVGISSESIIRGLRPETLGEFSKFSEKFVLAEGAHLIGFGSVDAAGNYGLLKTRTINADGTVPGTELSVNGVSYAAESVISSVVGDTITISAVDVVSNGVASGLATTYMLINVSPEICESGGTGGGINGIGSCENHYYPGTPFTLAEGTYTIHYTAVDKVGNMAAIKSVMIRVQLADVTPPVTSATLVGTMGSNGWYSSAVKVALTPVDASPGSVAHYSLEGSTFAAYLTPIDISSDGYHAVRYYAVDAAGNTETEQTVEFKIDAAAPVVSYMTTPQPTISGWNNSAVEVVFSATDAVSGVDSCLPSQPVSVESGSRTVVGYCADMAGNIAYSTATVKIDITAPMVTAAVRGTSLEEGITEEFAVVNTITMTAMDPVSSGLSAGIAGILYSVDVAFSTQTAAAYTAPFQLGLGAHTLYYAAVDNAGNMSQVKSASVNVTPHETYYVSAITGNDSSNGLAMHRAFATIGKAIFNALAGDTVLVSTGVYHEAVSITKSGVAMRAIGDAVLDGDTNGDGTRDLGEGISVRFVPNVSITGFVVKNYLNGITGTMADSMRVSSCTVLGNVGVGIEVANSANAVIEQNTVANNWRGMSLSWDNNLNVHHNLIYRNQENGINVGVYGSNVASVQFNTIANNFILAIDAEGLLTFKNNIVRMKNYDEFVINSVMPVMSDYNDIWVVYSTGTQAPRGPHDLYTDPYFFNEAADDYRLEAGSPAIGAGESGATMGYYQGPFLQPVITARINAQTVANGAAVSMTDADNITLDVTNTTFGVKDVLYTLNAQFSTATATTYSGAFTLQLGSCTLNYSAVDNAGRLATVKSARLTVNSANYGQDATAPITTPYVNGVRISTGAPTYVRYGSTLTFTATDPIFENIRSGVAFTTYTFTMYAPPDWVFVGAANYTEPLLATMEGQFTLYFRSRDNAGNWEQQRNRVIYVDGTPPDTAALVRGITVQSGAAVTIASSETVTLSASDPVSGLVSSGLGGIRYTIDAAYSVAASTAYTSQPISFSTGTHTLYYTASDGVGNQAAVKTAVITVTSAPLDTMAPVTRPYINGVLVSSGTAPLYMRYGSQLTLVPTDMPTTGYSSGVAFTTYTVTQYISSAWVTIASGTYAGALVPQEGYYTLYFRSRDNAGNWESQKSRLVYVDGTAPDTSAQVRGVIVESGASVTITSTEPVTLSAQDPVSGYASSGLGRLMYTLDTAFAQAAAATYGGPISLTPGAHMLYYAAADAVGNLAAVKSLAATVLGSVASPVNIGGAPEVLFSAPVSSVTVTQLPPDSPQGIAVLGEASAGGLQPVSNIYELGPDGDYPELTNVTFAYSPESLPAGVTEADLALYEHFDGTGWVRLSGQVLDTVNHRITAPITQIASLFAIFGPIPQTTLPIVPSSGPIGVPFSITGSDFGTYSSGITVVLIGGATAPISVWNDSTISGTIPGSLAAGEYAASVKRGTATITGVQPFTVAEPSLLSIAPSSGAIGVPFTLIGAGFGNYVAGYTKVLIGGVAAPVSLWTDGKIQGTVPGSLAAGDYDLVVRRELNGGVSASQPVLFKVLVPTLAAIVPSSGAIGVGYTLTGSGFGNYVANYTRVLIGGATTPVSLWTDTKISGTVPGSLVSGTYEVAVERELNGGLVRSGTVSFTLVAPSIASMAPSSGAIGVPFTITGAGFGNYVANFTKVLIGGATAPVSLWTDTKIQGTVPGALAPGDHDLLVTRELNGGVVTTQPVGFKVLAPEIATLTPSSGAIGVPFTITGAGFGNYVANYTRVLIGGATAPVSLWTDTKIQGTVPGSLPAGDRELVIERALNGGVVRSAALAFSVIVPEIGAVSPSSGPIGLPFTILGSGFGNYVANYTKVLIGGTTAPVSLWTDTKIQGSIPGALSPGEYELLVERALNGGVVRSAAGFTVAAPVLETVSPSTAAVIAPFTLTGYNFGNYVANYTKVLINGTTTSVTLWTDTKIQGKLPFLPAGQYPVQVQRVLNGGSAESAVAWINVEEPAISSMTPASGATGTAFTLYGTGFGSYDASLAHVTMGGAACAVSLWTDTKITGTVPAALGSGTHAVVASRGQALSNPLEYYIPGGYGPSSMMRVGLTQPAQEFRLGEVYVYPDPAKAGKVPTFHIEVGAADSVKIRVFTVAGQLAHEQTLIGSPQDTGQAYAYEYAWTGRIASGVYYYTIEAERSGKKLKAKGKFSVVR